MKRHRIKIIYITIYYLYVDPYISIFFLLFSAPESLSELNDVIYFFKDTLLHWACDVCVKKKKEKKDEFDYLKCQRGLG